MYLLSVLRPHILPLDHQVPLNNMIRFHLKWWMDTNRFVQGTPIHSPDPNAFLYTDASHNGWGVHLEPMSLSFHGLWSEDQSTPYQYAGNNGHSFRTEESHKIYSSFSCHDVYRQHNSSLLYQQTRENTFSQPVCRGKGDLPLVPRTQRRYQSSTYPRQIQCFGISSIENGQTSQKRIGIGPINRELHFPNAQLPHVDLFATRINHKLPLYVSPVPDNQALAIDVLSMNWNFLHAYEFPSAILIPSLLAKIRQSRGRFCLKIKTNINSEGLLCKMDRILKLVS